MIKITISADSDQEIRMTTFIKTIVKTLTGEYTEYEVDHIDYETATLFIKRSKRVPFPTTPCRREGDKKRIV